MKISKRVNINKTIFNLIIILLGLKLIFSYLMVDLGYWLRDLISNYDSFNVFGLPQNFSSKIEFVLIPLFVLYISFNFNWAKKYLSYFLLFSLFIFLNLLTSAYNSIGILNSLELTFKIISPIIFFIILVIHFNKYDLNIKKLALKTVGLSIILCIIAIIFFNPSSNRGLERYLPIYFESIHTHSYILVSIFIILSFPLYIKKKNIHLLLFLTASFIFLWKGYAIRTAMIVYLIYIMVILFNIHAFFKYLWIKLLVYAPIIFLLLILIFSKSKLDEVTSGRLSMYSEKVEQIKNHNFIELIIGKGKGSDLIRTEVWASSRKGAHSDILTFIVENGFFYFFIFLCLFYLLLIFDKKGSWIYNSIIIGFFISSIISNGIATRPLAGYMFFLALAFVFLYEKNNKKLKQHNL